MHHSKIHNVPKKRNAGQSMQNEHNGDPSSRWDAGNSSRREDKSTGQSMQNEHNIHHPTLTKPLPYPYPLPYTLLCVGYVHFACFDPRSWFARWTFGRLWLLSGGMIFFWSAKVYWGFAQKKQKWMFWCRKIHFSPRILPIIKARQKTWNSSRWQWGSVARPATFVT